MQQPQEPQQMPQPAQPQQAPAQPAVPPEQPGQTWQVPQPAQPWQYQTQNSGQHDPYQQNPRYYQQQAYAYAQPFGTAVYPMSETDKTLRLIAFILNLISLIAVCWAIIPLAWMIPMCVRSWGIYKGTKPNTVAFGVCTLIFLSLVAGILLLISKKDR